MRDYFEAEMRLLHEAAQEFARAYPEQARMLNLSELRDRDPYIERLLEGTAYLTASIRQRIEASETAISQQLLAQVCPQQLSPYPSTAIMEFRPESHRQADCTIEGGSEVCSVPVGKQGVACRFRTLRDVRVMPLSIERVTAEEANSYTSIRLAFRLDGTAALEDLELDALPLFLHADQPLALALYQGFCHGLQRVRVHVEEAGQTKVIELGGQACMRPMHLEPEEAMLPLVERGQPGFALLHDYFCAREKFLFVALEQLQKIKWPEDCQRFEIELQCGMRLPPEHKLAPRIYGCTAYPQ
ncbi:type VI secretion system baseplate subunit TssF [Alkalilimnicola ehrlichii]|nr:type VI secretion system baseplate subunit TssF [Alkalilimnicola ehrlichii]